MQTRSQTRNSMNVSNVGSTSTPYQIHTRASTRNQSPVSSPRQTPIVTFEIEEACFEDEDITILDAEFAEYDSSSDYDPNESYSVDIDFDEASNAWRANKRSTGNGCFKYVKNAFQEPKKTGRANTENTHSMMLRSRA
jgi:hypothetical protein